MFELEKRGYVKAGPWTPEATVEHPEAVRQLHREFLRAGADVMQAGLTAQTTFNLGSSWNTIMLYYLDLLSPLYLLLESECVVNLPLSQMLRFNVVAPQSRTATDWAGVWPSSPGSCRTWR